MTSRLLAAGTWFLLGASFLSSWAKPPLLLAAQPQSSGGADIPPWVRLTALDKRDFALSWHWRKYCLTQGKRVHHPRLLPSSFVLHFLESFTDSSYPRVDMASEEQNRELKDVCDDAAVNWHWHWYCQNTSMAIYRGQRQPAQFVQWFLDTYHQELLPAIDMASREDAAAVNALRQCRPEFRKQWFWYAKEVGLGLNRPELFPAELVHKYLKNPGGVVEMTSDEVIGKLRSKQQSDPQVNWLWHVWCAYEGEEVRDARRLPIQVTTRFLELLDMGAFSCSRLTSPKVALHIKSALTRDRNFKRWWEGVVRRKAEGIRSPRLLPFELVLFLLRENQQLALLQEVEALAAQEQAEDRN